MSARKATKAKKPGHVRRIMHGQVVSLDFFARHWVPVLLIVAFLLVYISGRYITTTRMEEITRLTRTLEVVKAESVRARSEYMGRTSESAMQQLVDTILPGLAPRQRPPYILE